MKEVYYSSHYAEHAFDKDTHTLHTVWFPQTHDMTEAEFKQEMEKWLQVSETLQPRYIFDYCVDFLFPISNENQVWLAQLLNPNWIAIGVKKYAHIVPQEFITNLSVDLMFEEFTNMNLPNQFEIKHFADANVGLAWLQE